MDYSISQWKLIIGWLRISLSRDGPKANHNIRQAHLQPPPPPYFLSLAGSVGMLP